MIYLKIWVGKWGQEIDHFVSSSFCPDTLRSNAILSSSLKLKWQKKINKSTSPNSHGSIQPNIQASRPVILLLLNLFLNMNKEIGCISACCCNTEISYVSWNIILSNIQGLLENIFTLLQAYLYIYKNMRQQLSFLKVIYSLFMPKI